MLVGDTGRVRSSKFNQIAPSDQNQIAPSGKTKLHPLIALQLGYLKDKYRIILQIQDCCIHF
jgi:hypothetical protein